MAMTGGSATITVLADLSVSVSGSGMALAIAQQLSATLLTADINAARAAPNTPVATIQSTTQGVATFYGRLANAIGPAVVSYVQSNATAHVTTQSLGVLPSPVVAGAAIAPPAAAVDVPIT